MGRKEERKNARAKKKSVRKRVSNQQLDEIKESINEEIIKEEVERRAVYNNQLLIRAMNAALKENGISSTKIKMIMQDLPRFIAKEGEKRNGKS